MPTVRFEVTTPLAPESVLQALTDFSDRRPQLFRNIDRTHFRVHGLGPDWADVTEGNVLAWERNRYDWDQAAGTVTVKTVTGQVEVQRKGDTGAVARFAVRPECASVPEGGQPCQGACHEGPPP